MSDTTHGIAGLIGLMTRAIDAVRPGGVFSSNSKLSAALFALYEAMPALTDLQAERDAWKARAEAAEAALTRAWERGRDDALAEVQDLRNTPSIEGNERAEAFDTCCDLLSGYIRALPVPADLAKEVADE